MGRKPSQTPIYRQVEQLLTWAIPMSARLPKSLPYQVMGGRFISDINDCLHLIGVAYVSQDSETRAQCYNELTLKIVSLKTAVRVFVRQRYTTPKGASVPVLSPRHEAFFIEAIVSIERQLDAWLNKGKIL